LEGISGFLTSVGQASREALILNDPTKIVEKLSVNSRCNNINKKLISSPVDIALQTVKKQEIKFRTIRPKSNIVGATTDICVASEFTTYE
jgi:hypothetical protein